MKRLVEKYYSWIFPTDDQQEVTYSGKVFLFWFTLSLSAVILFLIVRDVLRNVQAQ